MNVLPSLYDQAPYWIWFGLSGLTVSLALAVGRRWPLAAALGAGLVCIAELLGLRAGLLVEACAFVTATGVVLLLVDRIRSRRAAAAPRPPTELGARLVGRIARTTGEFANGVGRVRLDGSEWSAELDRGEEPVPPDAAVRVVGVVGGVKLQVRAAE